MTRPTVDGLALAGDFVGAYRLATARDAIERAISLIDRFNGDRGDCTDPPVLAAERAELSRLRDDDPFSARGVRLETYGYGCLEAANDALASIPG